MSKCETAGFTLIELILVMAISAALAAAALTGFSALRGQAQFSDSVERLKESVLTKRTEALTTVKLSGGTDITTETFGKLLTFSVGSGVVKAEALSTANNAAPTATQPVNVVASETTSVTAAWGLTYQSFQITGSAPSAAVSGTVQVAFVRSATDGTLQTAVSGNGGFAKLPSGAYRYDDFLPNGASKNLNFQDPSSPPHKAYLTIDPSSNGVTRVFP